MLKWAQLTEALPASADEVDAMLKADAFEVGLISL